MNPMSSPKVTDETITLNRLDAARQQIQWAYDEVKKLAHEYHAFGEYSTVVALQRELDKTREERDSQVRLVTALHQDVENLSFRRATDAQLLNEREETVKSLERTINAKNSTIVKLDAELNTVRAAHNSDCDRIRNLEQKCDNQRVSLERMLHEVLRYETEIEQLKGNLETQQGVIDTLKGLNAKLNAEANAKLNRVDPRPEPKPVSALETEVRNEARIPFDNMSPAAQAYLKAHVADVQDGHPVHGFREPNWSSVKGFDPSNWALSAYRIRPEAKFEEPVSTPRKNPLLEQELRNEDLVPFYKMSAEARNYLQGHEAQVESTSPSSRHEKFRNWSREGQGPAGGWNLCAYRIAPQYAIVF